MYAGMTVGGCSPKQHIVHGSPRLRLSASLFDLEAFDPARLAVDPLLGKTMVQATDYRYERIIVSKDEFGLWVPDHWTMKEALEELIRGYKPRKGKPRRKKKK